LFAIHENVIANQQRVFHRTGGNLKGLQDERDDKKAGDQDSCQRREKLHGSFALLLYGRIFFLSHLCWFPVTGEITCFS
jgi:hypothetical protein